MEKGFCTMPIESLVKADWNYKTNNEALSEKLANNIKRNGQIENIIIRELDTGFFEVVNGNHRLDVLKSIGFLEVHCFNLGSISESQAKRIAIETNETKFDSNEVSLNKMLVELTHDFKIDDLLLTMPFESGDFELMNLDELGNDNDGIQSDEQNSYTNKITTPIYEITKEKPKISELTNCEKYNELIKNIDSSEITEEEKQFLRISALRHIVFNYDKIAEFYAHSEQQTQQLMENSALVIIDFNKAIELGYVKLANDIAEQYGVTNDDE